MICVNNYFYWLPVELALIALRGNTISEALALQLGCKLSLSTVNRNSQEF